MSNDTKEFLKSILARIEGKKESDIDLKDIRTEKKRKKKIADITENKDVINNEEGILLTGKGAAEIEWDDIKGKKKYKIKENLEEWTTYDFYFYTRQIYNKKFVSGWNLRIGGAVRNISLVKDKLADFIGFNSNLITRDYINFFFEHYASGLKKEKSGFYFRQLLADHIIQDFVDNYDYKESHAKYINSVEKKEDRKYCNISYDEMKKSYQLSINTLLCNFGLVLGLNWLIHAEKIDKYKAAETVSHTCYELKEKKLLEILKNATEFFSPYPTWLTFKKPDEFIKKIDPYIRINVVFSDIDDKKFDFLNIRKG